MLLRRVSKHVKEENWFAIAIDFLIVVVGVFIGMQVANWNQVRANERLGQDYTARLIVDLKRDLGFATMFAGYNDVVLDSILETDRLLADPNSDSRALVIAAYRASEIASNLPSAATWEQIVSSGHLGLLPDGATESGLAEYYVFARAGEANHIMLQNSDYRFSVRKLIPLSVQLAIREGCSDVVDNRKRIAGFVADCEVDVEQALLEETAEQLRASPEISANIRLHYSSVLLERNGHVGQAGIINDVLKILEPEEVN